MKTINTNIELVVEQCCNCGTPFAMPRDAANGKKPLPDAEECRQMALTRGIPYREGGQ